MNKVGLLFGSFNPPHNGHLDIAKAGLRDADCHEVWFILQAHNHFKKQNQAAPLEDRMLMLRFALANQPKFKLVASRAATMVEGLAKLSKFYRDYQFVLLMGQDLVESLPSWKDHKKIINKYQIYGYRRGRSNGQDISSDLIRQRVENYKGIGGLVPPAVARYIKENRLYIS